MAEIFQRRLTAVSSTGFCVFGMVGAGWPFVEGTSFLQLIIKLRAHSAEKPIMQPVFCALCYCSSRSGTSQKNHKYLCEARSFARPLVCEQLLATFATDNVDLPSEKRFHNKLKPDTHHVGRVKCTCFLEQEVRENHAFDRNQRR